MYVFCAIAIIWSFVIDWQEMRCYSTDWKFHMLCYAFYYSSVVQCIAKGKTAWRTQEKKKLHNFLEKSISSTDIIIDKHIFDGIVCVCKCLCVRHRTQRETELNRNLFNKREITYRKINCIHLRKLLRHIQHTDTHNNRVFISLPNCCIVFLKQIDSNEKQ